MGLEITFLRLVQEIARAEIEIVAEQEHAELAEPIQPYPANPEQASTKDAEEPGKSGTLDQAFRALVVDSIKETLPPRLDRELSLRGFSRRRV